MIGIVIVAHGGLARELLATVEHVLGRQENVRAISIGVNDARDAKTAEIVKSTEAVDRGSGVVIVTDMFGGSPSNLSLPACSGPDRVILYGANLPLLIKLAKSRHKPLPTAVTLALDAGRKYIDVFDVQEESIAEPP